MDEPQKDTSPSHNSLEISNKNVSELPKEEKKGKPGCYTASMCQRLKGTAACLKDACIHYPSGLVDAKELSPREILDKFLDQLDYSTTHLHDYSLLDKLVNLKGEPYRLLEKALWYQVYALPIRHSTVIFGSKTEDLRLHISFPMPSGSGKSNLKKALKAICKAIHCEAVEPTSFHPEQFVGKVEKHKNSKKDFQATGERFFYEEIPGHFQNADVIVFDEAIDLCRAEGDKYAETRAYLNIGKDTFPDNIVTKKAVNIPKENAIKFAPFFATITFYQPFHLPEENVLRGFLNRDFIIFINSLHQRVESLEALDSVLEGNGINEKEITDFYRNQLSKYVVQPAFTITLDPSAYSVFKRMIEELILVGTSFTPKLANFTALISKRIWASLIKLAAIHAFYETTNKDEILITESALNKAYVDMFEFFVHSLDFVERKILGLMDYGETWDGATGQYVEVLEYLNKQGATSFDDSKVTIEEIHEQIKTIFSVESKRSAQYKLKTMCKRGWVGKQQKGTNDSRVWLNIQPKVDPIDVVNSPVNLKNTLYFELIQKIDTLKPSIVPSEPSESNVEPLSTIDKVEPKDTVVKHPVSVLLDELGIQNRTQLFSYCFKNGKKEEDGSVSMKSMYEVLQPIIDEKHLDAEIIKTNLDDIAFRLQVNSKLFEPRPGFYKPI